MKKEAYEARKKKVRERYHSDLAFRRMLLDRQKIYNRKKHATSREGRWGKAAPIPCMIVTADEAEVTIGYYPSLTEAAAFLGSVLSVVSRAAKFGKRISMKGQRKLWYRIIYIDEKTYKEAVGEE